MPYRRPHMLLHVRQRSDFELQHYEDAFVCEMAGVDGREPMFLACRPDHALASVYLRVQYVIYHVWLLERDPQELGSAAVHFLLQLVLGQGCQLVGEEEFLGRVLR